jgi:YesN/AraC family two-component response regulator
MNTILQKLIDEFTDVKYTMVINKAKELLVEEKQQIKDAWEDGCYNNTGNFPKNFPKTSEEY